MEDLEGVMSEKEGGAVAWRTRWKTGSERDREWEMWTYRNEQPSPHPAMIIEPLYAIPDAAQERIRELTEALVLAEDVLSRAPFSTALWPNGMHPQRGIEAIRAALSTARPIPEKEERK